MGPMKKFELPTMHCAFIQKEFTQERQLLLGAVDQRGIGRKN